MNEDRLREYEADMTPLGAARQIVNTLWPRGACSPEPRVILDPAAGNGSIGIALRERFPMATLVAVEPRVECRPALERIYTHVNTMTLEQFACMSFPYLPCTEGFFAFDAVITNPPFSMLREFIERGHRFVKASGSVTYLALSTFGQAHAWREILSQRPVIDQHRIGGRLSFRTGRTNPKTGKPYGADQRDYSWWTWRPGYGVGMSWRCTQLPTLSASERRSEAG